MKSGAVIVTLCILVGAAVVLGNAYGQPNNWFTPNPVLPPPPAEPCIAFSASGTNETAIGSANLLMYDVENADTRGAWDGSTFEVPRSGVYYFNISMVRQTPQVEGSGDDVYIYLTRNGNPGTGEVLGYAWAGQSWDASGSGYDNTRTTGAFSIAIRLNEGDLIETYSGCDCAGSSWAISKFEFTGFYICR